MSEGGRLWGDLESVPDCSGVAPSDGLLYCTYCSTVREEEESQRYGGQKSADPNQRQGQVSTSPPAPSSTVCPHPVDLMDGIPPESRFLGRNGSTVFSGFIPRALPLCFKGQPDKGRERESSNSCASSFASSFMTSTRAPLIICRLLRAFSPFLLCNRLYSRQVQL